MRPQSRDVKTCNSISSVPTAPAFSLNNGAACETTPYQVYRVQQKTRRKIFTSQMVQSKNKILRKRQCQNPTNHNKLLLGFPNRQEKYKRAVRLSRVPSGPGQNNLNQQKNFLNVLGSIDPELKRQTLQKFHKINDIKNLRSVKSQMMTRNIMG